MTNQHEILIHVDENDNITGPVEREKAHREGIMHRGVMILVFNGKGQLLIQKRSAAKDTAPGKWALSAAGHVLFGESYEETARRELKEEIGIDAPLYEMGKIYDYKKMENNLVENEMIKLYMCEHEGPFRLQESEVEEVRFVSIDEIVWMIQEHPETVMHTLKDAIGLFFADVGISPEVRLISHDMIDYVDEKNNVIGPVPREEAHRKGLLHRAVWIIVVNKGGEILIQRRHKKKKISPGFWELSATGHVDSGETYEAAAKRELLEEIGIEDNLEKIGDGLFVFDHRNGFKDREFYRIYLCRSDGPFKEQEDEIEEIRFVSAEELEGMIKSGNEKLTNSLIMSFEKYKKKIKQW